MHPKNMMVPQQGITRENRSIMESNYLCFFVFLEVMEINFVGDISQRRSVRKNKVDGYKFVSIRSIEHPTVLPALRSFHVHI